MLVKRKFLAGLLSLPLLASAVAAADNGIRVLSQRNIRWKVPADIKRIRVRAWDAKGEEVLDTYLHVKPNQLFQIDVVE